MLFSRAVLAGCLAGLKWLLWLVAILVALLVAAKTLRNEPLEIAPLLIVTGVCAAGGFVAGMLAGWIKAMR